jgi:hypothetical protein
VGKLQLVAHPNDGNKTHNIMLAAANPRLTRSNIMVILLTFFEKFAPVCL